MTSAEDTASPQSRTQAVANSFGHRARDYTSHAHLQQHTARALAAFLHDNGGLPSGPVVEIGCGTGLLTELLHAPGQPYLATDLSPEMLEQCRARLEGHAGQGLSLAVLDGQTAAFAAPPAAIVSNLTCQWFVDPVSGIARLARQTPLLAFSVPLHGSFPEWEAAFADLGRTSGLLPLPREHALLAALEALGPARLVHSVEERPQHFPSATAFADSFRLIGADQPRAGYVPAPIRPVLKRFSNGLYATARILYCLVMRETP
ncbi:MAG: methyltransferase domain-containing protein [Humidesulfovibrio sp.]|nr:methyltransferase domain-containing protein [Humidesulfovibrio sp.]